MSRRERHRSGTLPLLVGALVLVGCSGSPSADPVAPSALTADPQRVPGPAYVSTPVWTEGVETPPSTLVWPAGSRDVDEFNWMGWTRTGTPVALTFDGRRVRTFDGKDATALAGVRDLANPRITPDGLTTLSQSDPLRIEHFSADLATRSTIQVRPDDITTDQAEGPEAELQLRGSPLTLDGVTWVEWGVNSEDDTRTDHGVLRIEDGTVRQVLRNESIVRLYAAYDGSAVFVLRQDNGKEDCGGCVVAQNLAEIDPATGKVAAEYGMPPGYSKKWRVDAVDKVGDRVAVRFVVHDDVPDGGTAQWQTWIYDGAWSEFSEVAGRRVWFQDGGRLVQTPRDELLSGATDPDAWPATLTWVPGNAGDLSAPGARVLLEPDDQVCRSSRVDAAETFCPTVVASGSLLPPA